MYLRHETSDHLGAQDPSAWHQDTGDPDIMYPDLTTRIVTT